LLLSILLALIVPRPAEAEQTLLTARPSGTTLLATARLDGNAADSLLAAVREGLTSEIVFQFRLYQTQHGLRGLFGGRLLLERKITRLARMDIFDGKYIIRSDPGEMVRYRDEEAFIRQFFQAADVDLGIRPDGCVVLARIRYSPVRLVAPLAIISLFTRRTAVTTRWAEVHIPAAEADPAGEAPAVARDEG
jgi:hypothetical protein